MCFVTTSMTRDLAFDLLDELINHRKCKNWQLVGHKHCNFNELTINLNCSPTALRKVANQLINEKRIFQQVDPSDAKKQRLEFIVLSTDFTAVLQNMQHFVDFADKQIIRLAKRLSRKEIYHNTKRYRLNPKNISLEGKPLKKDQTVYNNKGEVIQSEVTGKINRKIWPVYEQYITKFNILLNSINDLLITSFFAEPESFEKKKLDAILNKTIKSLKKSMTIILNSHEEYGDIILRDMESKIRDLYRYNRMSTGF